MLLLLAVSNLAWIEGSEDNACAQAVALILTPPETFLTEVLALCVFDQCVAAVSHAGLCMKVPP